MNNCTEFCCPRIRTPFYLLREVLLCVVHSIVFSRSLSARSVCFPLDTYSDALDIFYVRCEDPGLSHTIKTRVESLLTQFSKKLPRSSTFRIAFHTNVSKKAFPGVLRFSSGNRIVFESWVIPILLELPQSEEKLLHSSTSPAQRRLSSQISDKRISDKRRQQWLLQDESLDNSQTKVQHLAVIQRQTAHVGDYRNVTLPTDYKDETDPVNDPIHDIIASSNSSSCHYNNFPCSVGPTATVTSNTSTTTRLRTTTAPLLNASISYFPKKTIGECAHYARDRVLSAPSGGTTLLSKMLKCAVAQVIGGPGVGVGSTQKDAESKIGEVFVNCDGHYGNDKDNITMTEYKGSGVHNGLTDANDKYNRNNDNGQRSDESNWIDSNYLTSENFHNYTSISGGDGSDVSPAQANLSPKTQYGKRICPGSSASQFESNSFLHFDDCPREAVVDPQQQTTNIKTSLWPTVIESDMAFYSATSLKIRKLSFDDKIQKLDVPEQWKLREQKEGQQRGQLEGKIGTCCGHSDDKSGAECFERSVSLRSSFGENGYNFDQENGEDKWDLTEEYAFCRDANSASGPSLNSPLYRVQNSPEIVPRHQMQPRQTLSAQRQPLGSYVSWKDNQRQGGSIHREDDTLHHMWSLNSSCDGSSASHSGSASGLDTVFGVDHDSCKDPSTYNQRLLSPALSAASSLSLQRPFHCKYNNSTMSYIGGVAEWSSVGESARLARQASNDVRAALFFAIRKSGHEMKHMPPPPMDHPSYMFNISACFSPDMALGDISYSGAHRTHFGTLDEQETPSAILKAMSQFSSGLKNYWSKSIAESDVSGVPSSYLESLDAVGGAASAGVVSLVQRVSSALENTNFRKFPNLLSP